MSFFLQLVIIFISLIGPFICHYGNEVSAAGILESIQSDVKKILERSGPEKPINGKEWYNWNQIKKQVCSS